MVKGIVKTHRQLIQIPPTYLPPADGLPIVYFTLTSSFYWIASVLSFCWMIFYNYKLITTSQKISAELFMGLIERHKVNTIMLYPPIWKMIKSGVEKGRTGGISTIMVGGCRIEREFVDELLEYFTSAKIFGLYGSTECGVCTSAFNGKFPTSSGLVNPGYEIKVNY